MEQGRSRPCTARKLRSLDDTGIRDHESGFLVISTAARWPDGEHFETKLENAILTVTTKERASRKILKVGTLTGRWKRVVTKHIRNQYEHA